MNDKDIALIQNAINILNEKLGLVETEKFISLINRNKGFDYTEWQKDLFDDMSIDKLSEKAMEYVNSNKKN